MSAAAKSTGTPDPIGDPAKTPATAARPKPLVYFVDDEVDMLEIFEGCYSRKYQVSTFPSALELVEKIASKQIPIPQLIVTDLRMAKMDGVKMLSTLKSMGYEIPAILLSGDVDKTAAVEALNSGFFHLLEKPFEAPVLESYINELLMEAKIKRVREEVRLHVRKLTEIHQVMRLLLADKIDNLNEIMDQAVVESGGSHETFDEIVSRLEGRLDELLRVEELTESLRKHKR